MGARKVKSKAKKPGLFDGTGVTSRSSKKKPGAKPEATMPPALSDDEAESDGPDMIPAKAVPSTKADEIDEKEDEEEDDDDEDDDDDEVYVVEKILQHGFDDSGVAIYQIKWLGYDRKSDLTWEPVENLASASEILQEYHDKIGGPPTLAGNSKKKGAKGKRSAGAAFADSPSVEPEKKKGRKSTGADTNGSEWKVPEGSWEKEVSRVISIIEEADDNAKGAKAKATTGKDLFALLEWNNGNKTQHPIETTRRKCPQRLLDYYEQHLVFKSGASDDTDE